MNLWSRLKRVTAPAADPVTLAEAKAHLRILHPDEDVLVGGLIKSAVAMIDGPNGIGVALVTQTWRLSLDHLCDFEIPLWPVTSVDEIAFVDTEGEDDTVSEFEPDLDSDPVRVSPPYGQSWPSTRCSPGAVKVTFTAGFGEAAAVPADIKAAILLLIGHLYEHREAANDAPLTVTPLAVESILNRYRRGCFA